MLVEANVGIKPINQVITSHYFDDLIVGTTMDLKIEQCLANPDFLKDKYTLIGKNIYEMPHYELIRYLDNCLLQSQCTYFKRYQNGTLDFRRGKGKINEKQLKTRYQEKLIAMEKEEIFTMKVYLVDDDIYMIADGKHSLAMAAYFNYPNLRFDIIQNIFFDTYIRWLFERIADNEEFKKHHSFFKRAYDYRKRQINRIIEGEFDK